MKTNLYKTLLVLVSLLFSFTSTLQAGDIIITGATASSVNGTAIASNAIDGNDGTRWESEHGVDPQWLALSLEKSYDIGEIKIHWEGANAKAYTIKVSEDSTNWTTIHTETAGATGARWDNISLSSTSAKYIVIDGTERNLTYGYSIYEVELVEVIPTTEDATLSDLTVDGTTIADFESSTTTYTYFVNDAIVPTIIATESITGASAVVTPATSIPGTTTIKVTATDGSTTAIYEVNFEVPVVLPLDFESSTLVYAWGEFGAPATVIDNPQISGINTSSKVAQIVKNAGEDWAGSYITIDNSFDLSTETRVSAKFYSPRAGINMMMKLEDASGNPTSEIQVATTVANEWETLTFDFAVGDVSKDYVKVVIICDRATVGDGTADHTYLVDDIALYEANPATDATLSDIKVDGVSINAFSGSTTDYSYPMTSYYVPVITATANISGATVQITDATSVPGTATVQVTATDGTTTNTYTVNYTMNTECSGTSTEAHEGSTFTNGYNYTFETVGTDVILSFELLDEVVGIVAYLHNVTDDFVESPMTTTNGVSSITLSDQTVGADITVRCKFAYSGGSSITKGYTYTVGEVCGSVPTNINKQIESQLAVYPNPTTGILNINAADNELVSVYNVIGQLEKQVQVNAGTISIQDLDNGIYFVNVNNDIYRIIKK